MNKITPVTTLEELCLSHGAPTGNVLVDGLVQFLKETRSMRADDAACYLKVPPRLLSEAIRFFVGATVQNVIIRWRAYQALDLLDQGVSREEVVRRLGMTSDKVLENIFRRQFGTTIDTYRTGKARRNSNFAYNESREARRAVLLNARNLKARLNNVEEES